VITFALIGHNEAATLPRALQDTVSAAEDGDHVVFVDSASGDESAQIAAARGVSVISAPLGKGRAIEQALDACETEYICLIDADIHEAALNIPRELARPVRSGDWTMVVGEFQDEIPWVPSNTLGVYEPLIRELVPEAVGRFGKRPLTGFRVLNTTHEWGTLPPDFGVEAHLNVMASLDDRSRTCVQDIGLYRGRFLYKPTMGWQIARPILDWAEQHGRLDHAARPAWDAWVGDVVDHIASFRDEADLRDKFRDELLALAGRPLPAAR
jgi:glycosyltransferase involved in cell wall biosynthesis